MLSNNSENPLVSVVMGVHNEKDEYLRMALDSICHQTYKNIEFIIVDDRATDGCKQILSEYSTKFSSIILLKNEVNLGLTKSLNVGIQHAAGSFIARMDADDYSVPTRIEKQVRFLIDNPDIDICGTGVVSFGDDKMYMSPNKGLSNDEAQCYLFFSSTLCHPSVMMRKRFLLENNLKYDERVKRGQDYDLWERASVYGKLAVMEEVLLFYRLHTAQITSSHRNEQDYYARIIRLRRLSRIGIVPTDKEYSCHMLLAGEVNHSITVTEIKSWIEKVLYANMKNGFVNSESLSAELNSRFALYKLRNHHYLSLLNLGDLYRLGKIFSSRVKLKHGIKRETKKFYNLIKNVLY